MILPAPVPGVLYRFLEAAQEAYAKWKLEPPVRPPKSKRVQLTDEQRRDILLSKECAQKMADLYGVSKTTVQRMRAAFGTQGKQGRRAR